MSLPRRASIAKRAELYLLGQAEPDAEEVTHRRFDARLRFAIPVGAQNMVLQVMGFVAGDVVAEMSDTPRPINVRQHKRLAGLEHAPIVVSSREVSGGDAVGLKAFQGWQFVQGEILGLGKQPGAYKSGHEGWSIHRASLVERNGAGKRGGGSLTRCPIPVILSKAGCHRSWAHRRSRGSRQ